MFSRLLELLLKILVAQLQTFICLFMNLLLTLTLLIFDRVECHRCPNSPATQLCLQSANLFLQLLNWDVHSLTWLQIMDALLLTEARQISDARDFLKSRMIGQFGHSQTIYLILHIFNDVFKMAVFLSMQPSLV